MESGEFSIEIGESGRDIRKSATVFVESTVSIPLTVTETTSIGKLLNHPKYAPLIKQFIKAPSAKSTDASAAMGEGSEKMMAKMMQETPLCALVSYGRMTTEQLNELIASLNSKTFLVS